MLDPTIPQEKKTIDKVPVPHISSSTVKIQPLDHAISINGTPILSSSTPLSPSPTHHQGNTKVMTTAQILHSSPFSEVNCLCFISFLIRKIGQ